MPKRMTRALSGPEHTALAGALDCARLSYKEAIETANQHPRIAEQFRRQFKDVEGLIELLEGCERITIEWEDF